MQVQKIPDRPFFTQAARDAALATRQANALNREDIAIPEVFVVRRTSLPNPFAWEIRRFGAVVLDRSRTGYASPAAARSAGLKALADQGAEA